MMQATVAQLALFSPGSRNRDPERSGKRPPPAATSTIPPGSPLLVAVSDPRRGFENRESWTVDPGSRFGDPGRSGKPGLFERRRQLQDDLAEATVALDEAELASSRPRGAYLDAKGRLTEITQQRAILTYEDLLPFYEDWRLTSHRLYPLAKQETQARGWRNAILDELKTVNHAIERKYQQ